MPDFLNIVLMGAPGSGKGTQALKLVKHKSEAYPQIKHLSTGDLFRKHLGQKSSLGLLAQSYTDKGQLVPDEVTNAMVKDFLSCVDKKTLIVWDGFPRNKNQAVALEKLLKEYQRPQKKIIYLELTDKEIIGRLSGRLYAPQSGKIYHITNKPPKKQGICDVSGEKLITRPDDKKELGQTRLKVFHKITKPVLEYYQKQGLLQKILANQSPDQVFIDILKHLKA